MRRELNAVAHLALAAALFAAHAADASPRRAAAVAPAEVVVTNPEMVYTALPQCRLFNTKPSGLITKGGFATFHVSGTAGFEVQNGHPGGCGVPASAAVVALTLTTSDTVGDGSVSVFPAGPAGNPPADMWSFNGKNIASLINAQLGTNGSVAIRAKGAATNVIGDVTGYFAPQIQANINADGTIRTRTTRILSVTKGDPGAYSVFIDRDSGTCVANGTAIFNFIYVKALANGANKVDVLVWKLVGGSEVPVDQAFQLSVQC